MPNKYGVRIYPLPDTDIIIIKQTVKRSGSPRYVIDTMPDGTHRETHISVHDTTDIAEAVRQALRGQLQSQKELFICEVAQATEAISENNSEIASLRSQSQFDLLNGLLKEHILKRGSKNRFSLSMQTGCKRYGGNGRIFLINPF